jgi:4-amino-4-deoxy-L-arabinose transferase-like glycosyltransferase
VRGFSVEVGLWSLIGLLALFTRLWNLGAAPLTNAEAAHALSSLALTHGESISTHNPLFTAIQTLVFTLFGASDFSARLPVALTGMLLCLAPILLRHQIGRQRALLFGGLLALSPTLLFASRLSAGALLSWALAFTAWCFWQRGSHRAALVTAGILLACGIDALSPLIILLASVGLEALIVKPGKLPISRTDVLWAALAFVLACTAVFWRLAGLGDAFNGFAMWPLSFNAVSIVSFARLTIGSVIYEPLILLCAVCGIVILLVQQHLNTREAGWLVWIILSLLMLGLDNSRNAVGLVPFILGGAAYASITLTKLFSPRSTDDQFTYPRSAEGVVLGLSLVMLFYAYMSLSMYGTQRSSSWLFTALLGIMMVAGIGVIATLTYGTTVALRGIGSAIGLCLLLYTVSTGYGLTQTRATDPGEAYISDASDDGLRELVRTIQTASIRAYGDPHSLPIQVLDTAPANMRWALKDQQSISYVSHAANAPAILTSINRRPDESTYGYMGSAFRISASASLDNIRCVSEAASDQLDCTPLARWLTQRSFEERSVTRWIFWMRSDIAEKANGLQN